jgi:hydroxymethylpyrimidine/phosphomethylpyrimidine kinase
MSRHNHSPQIHSSAPGIGASPALPRVLAIAGTDPSGGAGLQADIKTITALGGYAQGVITAMLAQNTRGVESIVEVAAPFVGDQVHACLDDIGVDAVKIGMLHRTAVIEHVTDALSDLPDGAPLVLDPVMVAKSGHRLLDPEAEAALVALMLPRAVVLTPNIPEAAVLAGVPIETEDDMRCAGEWLLERGAGAVLMKGGHLGGPEVVDLLVTSEGTTAFRNPKLATRNTHGTGCALSSALATALALGHDLRTAAAVAVQYVHQAVRTAPGFGGGAGPLNHLHAIADTGNALGPKVGVLAVVWRDDRVLLVKRSAAPQAGHWGFPGGHLDPGESLGDGAVRELREETTIEARTETVLPPVELREPHGCAHYVLVPVRLTAARGEASARSDAVEVRWFQRDALPTPLCAFVDHVVAATGPPR